MNNLERSGVESFVGKCMATMLKNNNNIATESDRTFIKDLLPEVKLEKRTNVSSISKNKLEWNTIKCAVEAMIK
jgi:hypothetical protein